MPKNLLAFNPSDYALVADRITLFYETYPRGRILTELIANDAEVVFRAAVYRFPDETQPSATGWASERRDDGEINTVACLENTETSAVGRALANLGFTASRKRPSREEMIKAERVRRRQMRVAEAAAPTAEPVASDSRLPGEGREFTYEAPAHQRDTATIQVGEASADLSDLLDEAERRGFPAERSASIRALLHNRSIDAEAIGRLEGAVRDWLGRRKKRSGS